MYPSWLVSAIAATVIVPHGLRLRACRSLVRRNLVDQAVPVLERLADHPDGAREARRLLALGRYLQGCLEGLDLTNQKHADGQWESLTGGPVGAATDDDAGLLVWSRPGTEQVIVCFSNIDGGYAMMRGLVSVALMHRLLARLPVSVVYVRDTKRCFNLAGIKGLGNDYAACVSALRDLCAHKGWPRVYTFGASGGGYAALRFGLDIEARAALSLSGPTSLAFPEGPMFQVIHRIAPEMAVDLLPLFRGRERRPRLLLHYGALNAFDSEMAERMRELPEAELIPRPGFDGHSTLVQALSEQALGGLVDRLLSSG